MNMPRLIAFVGPLLAGTLIANFAGFGYAANTLFLSETRGNPLPEGI